MAERPRDYSFEALVEVTNAKLDELTGDERGRINAALKQLRMFIEDDYLLADAIHERAKAWAVVYPEIMLTPQALTGQWSSIQEKAAIISKPRTTQSPSVSVPPPGRRVCETCGGDKLVLVGLRLAPSLHPTEPGFEEYAPCPDCNPNANTEFWRASGSRFRSPDPADVRMRMIS